MLYFSFSIFIIACLFLVLMMFRARDIDNFFDIVVFALIKSIVVSSIHEKLSSNEKVQQIVQIKSN